MTHTNASRNGASIDDLIKYSSLDDPLKESWLWAQALGLAVAIAVFESIVFSVSNVVVIAYSFIMAKLCATEFDLSAFSSWQETTGFISIITGLTVAIAAAFFKMWFSTRYGSSAVTRNVHLALDLEEAAKLCLSALPPEVRLRHSVPAQGQVAVDAKFERSIFCTRHLIIRAIFVDTNETAVIINALPVLNAQWGLLSAFFCDYGRNREQAEDVVNALRPYMAGSRRRRHASQKRKMANKRRHEQVLREAPPQLGLEGHKLSERSPMVLRPIGQ